jgi:hypothetical protein
MNAAIVAMFACILKKNASTYPLIFLNWTCGKEFHSLPQVQFMRQTRRDWLSELQHPAHAYRQREASAREDGLARWPLEAG